jgi:REP element-mobilizing transposase RayT
MTADPHNEEVRKERLRRLDRIFIQSPIYFVTACTCGRRAILASPGIHKAFMNFAASGENHGAYVGAYVIMPDHVHLFVALHPDRTLGVWMKSRCPIEYRE